MPEDSLESLGTALRGGEGDGRPIDRHDIRSVLEDAFRTVLYSKLRQIPQQRYPDRTYRTNEDFWRDALSNRHFPGTYVMLEGFHLIEWLPFAPGRYYTREAIDRREFARQFASLDRDELTPNGKISMVQGGIGTIRLTEKLIGGKTICFMGATSSGVGHQGIPVALYEEQYHAVMPLTKSHGGCRARMVGRLQSLSDEMPALRFDPTVPRYCIFVEHVDILGESDPRDLLTTVAVMFASREKPHLDPSESKILNKSWTFCSFHPGSANDEVHRAAEWLSDYARRYSQDDAVILTDFDEHHQLFVDRVEFPLSDIVRGRVDWETLQRYRRAFDGSYIETYIQEYKIMGDQINAGAGSVVVNRSTVLNAFNRVKSKYGEETAKALTRVEQEINKSGNREAAENFESFNQELQKSEPKKSLLKSLWNGTVAALPVLKELPGVVTEMLKLFN